MAPWYTTDLVCPRDRLALEEVDAQLVCAGGHRYPVVAGVPVMLLDDVGQTMGIAETSVELAKRGERRDDDRVARLYLETIGLSDEEKRGIAALALEGRGRIDPVVAYAVAGTNGQMYRHLIGTLDSYPIPQLRMPPGAGRRLLDIGCNWGRWSIAAARLGYDVVGIDPSLGSILAAQRVSQSLGLSIRYVVGDARYLPFPGSSVDAVFSYSVLQHLSPDDVQLVANEVGRTLKPNGMSVVQFPTVFGVRCLYVQVRRRFRHARGFEVRYWTIPKLTALFSSAVGPADVSVDCYFGIGLQKSDAALMPMRLKVLLAASEALRRASLVAPILKYVADSVYVTAVKRIAPRPGS